MNSDKMFDPPDTDEIDIDTADPKKNTCDFHGRPAVVKVKRSYVQHASYIYLCAECEMHFTDNWGELFDDR